MCCLIVVTAVQVCCPNFSAEPVVTSNFLQLFNKPVAGKWLTAGWEQDEVQEPNADFKPNLVNTVCFLVQFIIQLITFGVNYQGPPFNTSIRDTKTLRYTFWWGSVFWAVLSLDLIPELTKMVSLVRSPHTRTACFKPCHQFELAQHHMPLS